MEAFTGLGAAVPMANMMTGEVVFGGIGSGLSSMLMTVLLAVFIGGLMVGRTPEYLGKQVGAREVSWCSWALWPCRCSPWPAWHSVATFGRASLFSDGPLGFSETLYAYVSQAFNNGSAFAGYTGYVQPNAPGNVGAFGITFADLLGGIAMLLGRYLPMVVALAIAGALAGRRRSPAGAGTLRTDTPVFAGLLIATIIVLAVLDFAPPLMLGPFGDGLDTRLR